MKLNLGISAMLVTAVLAGAAGGAVALSAAQGQDGPTAPSVSLHQVADEPTSEPAPSATPDPTQAAPAPSVADDPAPVSESAPIVEPVVKTETAQEAADRAKAEADRAKLEADRAAEQAAVVVAPTPTVVEPEPAPECVDGAQKSDPLIRDGKVRTALSYRCKDGAWVITGSEKYQLSGGSNEPRTPTTAPAVPKAEAEASAEDPAPVGAGK